MPPKKPGASHASVAIPCWEYFEISVVFVPSDGYRVEGTKSGVWTAGLWSCRADFVPESSGAKTDVLVVPKGLLWKV